MVAHLPSGAVVVTQPARVATAEARKAAQMFQTLEVPVLGIVENMAGAFGHGAGAAIAAELAVPFLGSVPFDEGMVAEGDAGIPTALARPRSEAARAMEVVAHAVASALNGTINLKDRDSNDDDADDLDDDWGG